MKRHFSLLACILVLAAMVFSIASCDVIDTVKGFFSEHTHEYSSEITTPATCTEKGVKTYTCSCEDSYTEEIPALGHTEVTVEGKAATCTEAGLTDGKKCSVCGVTTVEQTTIDATNHNFVDGVCSCGAVAYTATDDWGNELTIVLTDSTISFTPPMGAEVVLNYVVEDGVATLSDSEGNEITNPLAGYLVLTDGVPTAFGYNGTDYTFVTEDDSDDTEENCLEGTYTVVDEFGNERTLVVEADTFVVTYYHPMFGREISNQYAYTYVDGVATVVNDDGSVFAGVELNVTDGKVVGYTDNGLVYTVPAEDSSEKNGLEGTYTVVDEFGNERTLVVEADTFVVTYYHPMFGREISNQYAYTYVDGVATVVNEDGSVFVGVELYVVDGKVVGYSENGTPCYVEGYTPPVEAEPVEITKDIFVDADGNALTGTSYATYNNTYTLGDYSVTTSNVLGNTQGEKNVLQFKKNGDGVLTVSNVTVSSVTLNIISSFDYSANVSVKVGDTELTLPAAADVNAAGVGTGVYTSNNYEYKIYTVTVTLDSALTGDLVITNTTGFAVYMTSIIFE